MFGSFKEPKNLEEYIECLRREVEKLKIEVECKQQELNKLTLLLMYANNIFKGDKNGS